MENDEITKKTTYIRIIDDSDTKPKFSNKINTTKYTIYNWLPKSLFQQFRRVVNAYFLFTILLMLIGTYATILFTSPLNPFPTIGVLGLVFMITSIKEGVEDLDRARSDAQENNRKITIVARENDKFIERSISCQDIQTGDVIKLSGMSSIPADALLLVSSNYSDSNQCYVETANIDGETNLKIRYGPSDLLPYIKSGIDFEKLISGTISYELPNKNIHSFIGTLTLPEFLDTKSIPLSIENILLRGSAFSQTDWAYGVVLYTGHECKIFMNNRKVSSKLSRLELVVNTAIIIIFLMNIIVVTFAVASIYFLGYQNFDKLPYVYINTDSDGSILPLWFEQWLVFFLLYHNFLPISLYITLEVVNFGQAFMIANDLNLYDEKTNTPCTVLSSNLCQELGMISHLFTDKTGTLTRNEMRFVNLILDGVIYSVYDYNFNTTIYTNHGSSESEDDSNIGMLNHSNKLYDICLCIATCNTIIRGQDSKYHAESPDEIALILGIEQFNCFIENRGLNDCAINIFGNLEKFEILALNKFSSDRRCMSVLLKRQDRDIDHNQYVLMCKGADITILPLCKGNISNDKLDNLELSIAKLSKQGLRILCLAKRELNEVQAKNWLESFNSASISLTNRPESLTQVAAIIEKDMVLLGVTAIEDQLQDEVPAVITDIRKAGIVTWMLTGDKLETAINISYSCNLIENDTTKLFYLINSESKEIFQTELLRVHRDIIEGLITIKSSANRDDDDDDEKDNNNSNFHTLTFVIDGGSLKYYDESNDLQRRALLEIGRAVNSVIACRVTPVQKQQLVSLIKNDNILHPISLAIGDGANDVSMIREAHVGIGIYGKEGHQAANNADFAISQFKFLRRLLLIHGRFNYIRQSHVFLYSMHRNIVVALTLFWYNYYTYLSGIAIYESYVFSMFDVILGVPIVLFGIMDRDLSPSFVLNNPYVYRTSRENIYLQSWNVMIWLLDATLYSVVICLFYYVVLYPTFVSLDLYSIGTIVFTGVCVTLTAKVIFMHHVWTRLQLYWILVSLLAMLCLFLIFSLSIIDYYYVAVELYDGGIFWFFGFFSIVFFTSFIDVGKYFVLQCVWPTQEILYRRMSHEI